MGDIRRRQMTGRTHAVVVPAKALGPLHICWTIYEELEASHSGVEGDWSRWTMGGVAGPSAELCDDPCRPGDGAVAKVVLLELGPAFQGFIDGLEHFDLVRRERKFGWQFFTAISGLNELDDDTCRPGGDRHEFDQAFSAVELAILDAQTLALQRAKELFDDPALLVPGDDPPSIGEAADADLLPSAIGLGWRALVLWLLLILLLTLANWAP